VIKNPATRIVAAVFLVASLGVAPLLDNGEPSGASITPLLPQSPQFLIRWQRGELTLSGHTKSLQQEQDLLQVAKSAYIEIPVSGNFQPLGIVPAYWEEMTVQVLYLLAESTSGQAEISANEIKIHGITNGQPGWKNRLATLRKVLPPDVSIVVDTVPVDPTVSIARICTRAFADFESGPINFEESSTRFRRSAYPRLDRVIALANACTDSEISITGHSDSSGNDAWNQRLSLQRANAVGDYIAAGGVDRSRLQITAAGSSAPIADDSTRYGRSLNRRIEITLTSVNPASEPVIQTRSVLQAQ
jgi:outer membrane protein OmpA-like peptidoglycan-associated protein